MADLAERGDGLGLYLPSSSFLPPSLPLQPSSPHPYPYAVEFLIRLPKAIALSSSLVAWVADVRELPSSPRLFMAQVRAVAVYATSCVQLTGREAGIDDGRTPRSDPHAKTKRS